MTVSMYLAHPIDLSTLTDARLSFWHKHDLASDSGDRIRVEASSDGGITWTTLDSWSGGPATDWHWDWLPLTAYAGVSDLMIRFQLSSDSDTNTGDGWYIDRLDITFVPTGVAPDPENGLPEVFSLAQNYPNPFNPMTTMRFDLPSPARIALSIFDVSGRLVIRLLDENRPAGRHEISWDGTDGSGKSVPSGTYLYRIVTPDFTQTRRMTLVK